MKKKFHHQKVANQAVHKTLAVATSAVTLSLLGSAQNPLHAQQVPLAPTSAQPNDCADNDEDDAAARRKFFNMGYTYCDAKVLAAYWGEKTTPFDAKARLGGKILAFGADDGELHILRARAQALKKPANLPCTFADGGYAYKDAVALGKYWGTKEPYEAKMKMALLLVLGSDAVIKAALDEINEALDAAKEGEGK